MSLHRTLVYPDHVAGVENKDMNSFHEHVSDANFRDVMHCQETFNQSQGFSVARCDVWSTRVAPNENMARLTDVMESENLCSHSKMNKKRRNNTGRLVE